MTGIRVFGCYDLRHDEDLIARLRRDSERPDSPFELIGCSGHHGGGAVWEGRLRSELASTDAVVVICGEHGDTAVDLSAELSIAQAESKPYFLLWGRRELTCSRPLSARNGDSLYSWMWDVLTNQLALTVRRTDSSLPPAKRPPA